MLKLLLLLMAFSFAQAKHIALLIETEGGSPLFTIKDVENMQKMLGDKYEYIIFNEEEATSSNIRAELIRLSKILKENDTFVFFYSGHGSRFENDSSQENDRKDDFLVTSDILCNNDNEIKNVLLDDELNYRFSKIKAKKIVIIDACHSETMYKSFSSDNKYSKMYKGCSKGTFTRAFPKNPQFENAIVSNMIFLGASQENESAEGSREGGIFTLALAKALKENPHSSFKQLLKETQRNIKPIATRLNRTGAFVPSLSSKDINPNTFYAKDIFVVPREAIKEKFETYLNKHIGGFDLSLQGDKKIFTYHKRVRLKAKVDNEKGYISLVELLDQNDFTIIEQKPISECFLRPDKRYKECVFSELFATAPFGQSNVYAITSKNKLPNTPRAFVKALKKTTFKAQKISFEVYP